MTMGTKTTALRGLVRAAIAAVAMATLTGPASASWSDNNCNGGSSDIATWKRSQAKDYAQRDSNEGYEWGGGCFKLNDQDDTPNQPDSGGEGTDCSGLVFKTWALRADGRNDFRQWDHQKEIHGPFSTASFYSPAASSPFKTIAKGYASTSSMDAFVYRTSDGDAGHIGMLYSEGTGGSDYIIESRGDSYGTGIWYQDYRSSSAFRAVMREGWTPECYPRCAKA